MKLIKQLYDVLQSSEAEFKIIQIVLETDGQTFPAHESETTLDIGMSKKKYLLIFKEAHSFWHKRVAGRENVYQSVDLWDLYFMTLGYLITSNENHTIIVIHEEVTLMLYRQEGDQFLEKELDIITSYLTSRLKRINKSSSLWFWLKKLTIMLIYSEVNEIDHNLVIKRSLKSMELHFANYYAANFIRWCININSLVAPHLNKQIQIELLKLGHQNLKDVSLWEALGTCLARESGVPCDDYVIEEYNMLAKNVGRGLMKAIYQSGTPAHLSEILEIIGQEIRWLLLIDCPVQTPYRCLRQVPSGPVLVEEIETKLQQEQQSLAKYDQQTLMYQKKKQFISTLEKLVASN